ncbi:MAG: phenylalanine--tRNA ligase subunit alpha [Clostridiales bacterium]|jgi:phenylalanine--tRNA ligase, alpha subunit|nr:phenylalanine--tRNA ligase subunit alpha [Clostridiales bacterium]PWM20928.1 MAG: phenylalanine--tRNA ligase subunit alpha [Clostridiales bacterium]
MKDQLDTIQKEFEARLAAVSGLAGLDELKVAYLGKKGALTALLKGMGQLSPEERPAAGQLVNQVRAYIEQSLAGKAEELKAAALRLKLEQEAVDVTMPGKTRKTGSLHPIQQISDEMKDLFIGMGYEIADGPEIEFDYYNFEALNLPEGHPARDTQDTFYITDKMLLRTQTSSVQVRVMEQQKPPIRIICPGKVYRADNVDATHSPIFHQIEGLVVDRGVTMGDLKGTLEVYAKHMFGPETKIRLRPHHFPFTEPSAEVDVSCWTCGGKGCRMCKGEGWIEVLGCGMVHPDVLRRCGIDPEVYSGFAFGIGVERTAMARFGVTDMRQFFEGDARFLAQF